MFYICILKGKNSHPKSFGWVEAFVNPITEFPSSADEEELFVAMEKEEEENLPLKLSHPQILSLYDKGIYVTKKGAKAKRSSDNKHFFPVEEPDKSHFKAVSFYPEVTSREFHLEETDLYELCHYRLLVFRNCLDYHRFSEQFDWEFQEDSNSLLLKKIMDLEKQREQLYMQNKKIKVEADKLVSWYKGNYEAISPRFLKLGKLMNRVFKK